MGSALLDDAATLPREMARAAGEVASVTHQGRDPSAVFALRRQAAERVAAHRSRRSGAPADSNAQQWTAPRNARTAKIAAAVAERYAQTQSYQDFLAAEAERAVQQARAAAEIAELNAQALAAAQRRLLDAIDEQSVSGAARAEQPENPVLHETAARSISKTQERRTSELLFAEHTVELAAAVEKERRKFQPPGARPRKARRGDDSLTGPSDLSSVRETEDPAAAMRTLADGITIRLYQDDSGATRVTLDPPALPSTSLPSAGWIAEGAQSDEEAMLLDEEIAFRHEPMFEEQMARPEPLPANLIEFPRQLVAARKARPRLAEGPLRDEADAAPSAGQLRIFEVEPEQIVAKREASGDDDAEHTAQWSSILLDSRPSSEAIAAAASSAERDAETVATRVPSARSLAGIASMRRRAAAAAINATIITAAGFVFAAAFLWVAGHLAGGAGMRGAATAMLGRSEIGAAAPFAVCAIMLLAAMYQALFFTLSTATPGMRAARVALCTFSDENPTRAAVRRRLLALLLSAASVGFGFLWALLDEERLTWHDRMCGIYLRSY